MQHSLFCSGVSKLLSLKFNSPFKHNFGAGMFDYLKGRVVCGTVYGDMHLKDLLGSKVRVGYCIMAPDFYLVLHGLRCWKSIIMD